MPITGSQRAPLFAQLGVARVGATRVGYAPAYVFLTVGGVNVGVGYTGAGRVLIDSLTVTDVLNEQPNTMQWTARGAKPTVGQEVILWLGTTTYQRRLFAGHILDVQQIYVGDKPAAPNIQWQASAVDYTWQLGFKKVTAFYAEQSATAIAQSLITTYAAANGFTSTAVTAGLPTVPGGITFTDEDLPNALTRLAARIGAYWYVDYLKDLHFFLTDTGVTPTDLTASHPSLANFVHDVDLSQGHTRAYVEGRGTVVLAPVAVGDSIIPVASVDMFLATGEFLKVSPAGSDGGAQHLTFTGRLVGGTGSLVGPGVTPSSALTPAASAGSGIDSGAHSYAFTWVTAAGETLPSPIATVTHGAIAGPSVAPTVNSLSGNSDGTTNLAIGTTYEYVYTYSAHASPSNDLTEETAASTAVAYLAILASVLGAPYAQYPNIRVTASADARVYWIHLYRRVQGVGNYKHIRTGTNATQNLVGYNAGGADLPAANATFNQTAVTGIAVGPAGTTGRKVYRTVANGAQLKLWATIADNTSVSGTDATPDASLGANAPTSDTSGIAQPSGQVNQGATSIVVASTAPFPSTGGWAIIGNGDQVIRYTGFSAGALTGIPASGVGSVHAPVAYNSTVTVCPLLTGIPSSGAGSIRTALVPGDEVYLVVQCDNLGAQAALAARLGGDGIREEWIQDRRLSIPEATARGDAFLASRPLDAASVAYTCRDLNTVSGKDIVVNLVAPTSVTGTFKIQQVTWGSFRPFPTQLPTASVQASAQRFSFEDLLRRAR